jgi:hypothetical protein
MPRNGEVNRRFGIYKSACCGAEIVIPEDVTFPTCSKHPNQSTEWTNITDAERTSPSPRDSKKSDSAA